MKPTDFFDRELNVGDTIVYGKSSRHNPVNVGTILEMDIADNHTDLKVLGYGNTKPGTITVYHDSWFNNRIILLPEGWAKEEQK